MMTCMYCGGQTPDGSKFCEQCGAALPVEAAMEQPVFDAGAQEPIDAGFSAPDPATVGGQAAAPEPPQTYAPYDQAQQQGAAYQQTYDQGQQPYGQTQQPYDQAQPTFVAPAQADPSDTGSIGWAILAAFFPIVGIVLFFVWRNTKPKSAKVAIIGAVIGFVIGMMFQFMN